MTASRPYGLILLPLVDPGPAFDVIGSSPLADVGSRIEDWDHAAGAGVPCDIERRGGFASLRFEAVA